MPEISTPLEKLRNLQNELTQLMKDRSSTVFLVHEDSRLKIQMQQVLRAKGYQNIQGSASPTDVLSFLRVEEKPCIVFYDVSHAKMNGIEFLKSCARLEKGSKATTLFITKPLAVVMAKKLLMAGIRGFVVLPYQQNAFQNVLDKL